MTNYNLSNKNKNMILNTLIMLFLIVKKSDVI